MIRNFKALGLALVALLALSAVVASAASATSTTHKLTASSYPAVLHGTSAVGSETFTTEAGTVECNATYQATVTEASQEVTVTPKYTGCTAFGFIESTVTMSTCDYLFTLNTTTTIEGTHAYQANVDVKCPTGSRIIIHASTCQVAIPPQNNLGKVDIHNMSGINGTTKKDLTIRPTITGITYEVLKDGFLCPFSGTGHKTGATYTSHQPTTVQGYKDLGTHTVTSPEHEINYTRGEHVDIDIGA